MSVNKKNTLVLFIILIMIVVVGVGSYALLLWSSPNNTELTLKISDLAGVYFDTGNNINVSNLGPIFDYNKDGEETYFTITNYITTDLLVSANLEVNSISDNLKEESFKWVILSSENKVNFTKVNEGDFSSVSSGDSINLLPNETILKGSSKKYKLVIYIDGNVENPISMQDGSLSGVIKVNAHEPYTDFFVTNLATGFPTTGNYEVDTTTNCTNATATFDYTTKKLLVSNVSVASEATCSPIITQVTRPTLASKIKSLIPSGQTTVASTSFNDGSTLEIINSALDTGATSNDYRYRGVNPNNYIRFNNELWRIIGVFDQYSHGQTGQELVKIIRDDSIGGYVWDKDNINNWEDNDLFALLNTGYYNSVNGTGEAYCYHYQTSLTGKCDFTSKGIKEPYKSMIQNATWYLGGFNHTSVYSADMYKYERYSDTTNTTYYLSGNAVSVTDKPIGLMYASDYGYAAPSTCTSYMVSYSTSGCADKDWLKSNYHEWTITPLTSDATNVFYLYIFGSLNVINARYGASTRPVLYLKSNVYYISGDGSQTNPYIINM